MKVKFYWVALLASAAMIAQANAGGYHGGWGGGGGGRAFAAPAPSSHAAPSSSRGGSRSFGGYRPMSSGHRFTGIRPMSPTRFATHRTVAPNRSASVNAQRFTPHNASNVNHLGRSRAGANRAVANGQQRSRSTRQARNGNSLPRNWQNHVAARHSANWHRDWNRNRDHNWHGHHCRFINGSWVVFDVGFYPWWSDWYPGGYYYGYDDSDYDDSAVYQGQPYYGSSDQSADPTVAAAQEQLARLGYYQGEIDGLIGPETQRATAQFQSRQGLRVTGNLTTDTLAALGAGRNAAY